MNKPRFKKTKKTDFDPKKFKIIFSELHRSILLIGLLIILGVVINKYLQVGQTEQLLLTLTGLMGIMLGHYFGGNNQKS